MQNTSLLSRRPCSIPCHCRFKRSSLTGVVVDLSFERGVVARSSSIPPLGSKVTLMLGSDAEKIKLRGRVAYVQGKRRGLFGIEFSGQPEKNLESVKRVLFPREL